MTRGQFVALVSRLEESARHNPAGYRRRVLGLAFAGYGYLALVLLILVMLILMVLASGGHFSATSFKLALVVIAFMWMVLRAMSVKIPRPQGRVVTAKDAPPLFAMIDTLRHRFMAPRFHAVLVTDEFNASVVQIPRLGLLGWPRNYLVAGLPLLKLVTPGQFEAVLAHEFGHLSRGDGRTANWIYRVRVAWLPLQSALQQRKSWGSFILWPFFHWYVPYFRAYSFPLARANEYEADAAAAHLLSAAVLAQALTTIHVCQHYMAEHFWPRNLARADDQPTPAFAPFRILGHVTLTDVDDATWQRWIDRALLRSTQVDDTHPSLTDRLKAIHQRARMAFPGPGAAADALLGDSIGSVTAYFDDRWHKAVLPGWERRYHDVQKGRRRLAELDALAARQGPEAVEISPPEAVERAQLTADYGRDPIAAVKQCRALLIRAPDDAMANFTLGRFLLARGEDEGLALIEKAMRLDEEVTEPGCQLLRDYCRCKGRSDEADAWHRQLLDRQLLVLRKRAKSSPR